MISLTQTTTGNPWQQEDDSAMSNEAEGIRQSRIQSFERSRSSSYFLGNTWEQTINDLRNLCGECNDQPLMPETIGVALRFLKSFPPEVPQPELSVTPQGYITFEWAQSAHRILSISLAPDEMLYYASLDLGRMENGSFRFEGNFDQRLLALLYQILN